MRKLFPLILIVIAGCGVSGRNVLRPFAKADCAAAPCDSAFGYNQLPAGEVMLQEYPATETPIYAEEK